MLCSRKQVFFPFLPLKIPNIYVDRDGDSGVDPVSGDPLRLGQELLERALDALECWLDLIKDELLVEVLLELPLDLLTLLIQPFGTAVLEERRNEK